MKCWAVTILTLEQNPPERMFEMYIKKSLERILLKSQNFDRSAFRYTALFTRNSRFTCIWLNLGQYSEAKFSQDFS